MAPSYSARTSFIALILALVAASPTRAGNAEGQLDPTFGSGGRAVVPFDVGGLLFDQAEAVAVQPNGRILVAGNVRVANARDGIGLVRLLADGSIDSSFGTNGKTVYQINNVNVTARQVIVQPDGKVLVAGSLGYSNDSTALIVVRFKADGSSTDSSFGPSGLGEFDVSDIHVDTGSRPMALSSDGSIFVTGSIYANATEGRNVYLARYSTAGVAQISSEFNISSAGNFWDIPNGLALQNDGKLLLAATVSTAGGSAFAVARLDPDTLALDPSFNLGSGGIKQIDFGNSCSNTVSALRYTAAPVPVATIENIWIAGTLCPYGINDSPVVVSLDQNGDLTSYFNSGAPAVPGQPSNYHNVVLSDLVLQRSKMYGLSAFDKFLPILVSSGNSIPYNDNVDMLLTRLMPASDQRDTSFGSAGDQGIYFNYLGGGLGDDWPRAAVRYVTGDDSSPLYRAGYLIMVGSAQRNTPSNSNADFAIVRVVIQDAVYGNGFD